MAQPGLHIGGGGGALAVDSAIPTNRIGETLVAPWLRPTLLRPSPNPMRRVTNFQSGHGWTKSGATGTVSDDTSVFVQGSQSVKLVSDNVTADTTRVRSGTLGTTIDLTTSYLVVKLRVDDWSKLKTLGIDTTSDGFSATHAYLAYAGTATTIAQNGDWFTVAIVKGDLATTPFTPPTYTAINGIELNVQDFGTGAVTVNIQSVDVYPLPANGCIVLCFDDGWATGFTAAKPYMDKYGYRGTSFPIRDQMAAGNGGGLYMGINQLRSLHDDSGWDVGFHADLIAVHNAANGMLSLSTTDGTASKFSSFEAEIARGKAWLIANHFRGADNMAWPGGFFDAAHTAVAQKYFTGFRTFRSTVASSDTDVFPFSDVTRLRQMAVTNGSSFTAAATVDTALDTSMTGKKTVLLTFHGIGVSTNSWEYPVASFQTIIDHIASSGYKVKTLTEVMRDGVA